jgi:predicted Fe-Mo cluster-binding NifX family protein
MKIAIAATSSETDSEVSLHGARAEYYLFYDTDGGSIEAFPNPAAQAERGAGPQAAAYLISKGVNKVVAGQIGPKFRAELEDGGIDCIEETGLITEVITRWEKLSGL